MGKYLEALQILYGEPENNSKTPDSETAKTAKRAFGSNGSNPSEQIEENDPIPFTDHEIAEHKIDTEVHRDDRSFVRQQLIGAYGAERLARVDTYMVQFRLGAESVKQPHKKSNAGRRRANTWLRKQRMEIRRG